MSLLSSLLSYLFGKNLGKVSSLSPFSSHNGKHYRIVYVASLHSQLDTQRSLELSGALRSSSELSGALYSNSESSKSGAESANVQLGREKTRFGELALRATLFPSLLMAKNDKK